jgi:hypothetical protein
MSGIAPNPAANEKIIDPNQVNMKRILIGLRYVHE